ncbi:MAG: archaeal/vacuolar-type H+-ATPase subunit I [Candidatus Muiribacterium halophilum]|uniref:Archaeal/vacuolar-type H+-ATPase subunit I n=1 Tax=Muiribacterium halophilum TaxID=2053465 RepID=A0A2N5Z9G0_MUIH1|nr:MAG: archaeal/vacuolar-type H+-ATPase subunit I [Candidatus Muirbacterium halophilum]
MKGISHFISGVAAATFVSSAVDLANYEHSIIITLGGLFGILPDTLDFKFAKFFQKFDYEVDPHPENMNPQKIAETIAKCINEAYKEEREVNLMLHTVKLSADLFRQYSLYFDNENREVVVRIGPVVNMSKLPYPGTEYEGDTVGRAKLDCEVLHSYDSETYVDIFGGPDFGFEKKGDKVEAHFIPWHRKWSHSLTLGVFFGLLGWLIGLIFGSPHAGLYGFVMGMGFCVHVLEDQLGFMGSNLFWPFTKKRANGIHWMRSGDAWPNFTTVWLSLLIILFNLNRFNPPQNQAFNMSWVEFFGYTFFVPLTIMLIIQKTFQTIYAKDESSDEDFEEQLVAEQNKESKMENEETIG